MFNVWDTDQSVAMRKEFEGTLATNRAKRPANTDPAAVARLELDKRRQAKLDADALKEVWD